MDFKEYESDHALVLEGMYKGVEEQIEEVKEAVSREL